MELLPLHQPGPLVMQGETDLIPCRSCSISDRNVQCRSGLVTCVMWMVLVGLNPVRGQTPTREQMCDRWNADRQFVSEIWNGNKSTCDAGTMTLDAQNRALKIVNLYRWGVHGGGLITPHTTLSPLTFLGTPSLPNSTGGS